MKKLFLLILLSISTFGQVVTNPGAGSVPNATTTTPGKVRVGEIDYVADSGAAAAKPCNSSRVNTKRRRGYGNRGIDTCTLMPDGSTYAWVDDDPVFRPERYGVVVGDGTNDATSLQAMVDAAPAGNKIILPAGRMNLSSTVTINKQLIIEGQGDSTIFEPTGNIAAFTLTTGADGTVLRNYRIEGTKTNEGAAEQFGILATGLSDVKIDNVTFSGTDATHGLNIQIDFIDCTNPQVVNSRFERIIGTNSGFGYGVLLVNCSDPVVNDNRSIQSATQGRHHVYLSAGTNGGRVMRNIMRWGTSSAISCYSKTAQGWVENNKIENNQIFDNLVSGATSGGAIEMTQKVRNNEIRNNLISGTITGNGLFLQSVDTLEKCVGNIFENNTFVNSGLYGAFLLGAENNILRNNIFNGSSVSSSGTYYGLTVSPINASYPGSGNQLLNNTFIPDATSAGSIRINSTVANTVVRDNKTFAGTTGYTLRDEGLSTDFIGRYSVRKTLTYTDFSAASVSNYAVVHTLQPGESVESVLVKHSESFTGGALSAYTLSVGLSSNYTKYAPAFSIFQPIGSAVFLYVASSGSVESFGATTQIRALAQTGGANLNAATAGSVDITLIIRQGAVR